MRTAVSATSTATSSRSTTTAGSDRQTLGSLSVFRGNADFVFYQRDIFTRERALSSSSS